MAIAPCRFRSDRAGAIALEMMFNLPIWLISLLGVVELGAVLSAAQQVSLASRVGAEEAACTEGLAKAGGVPANVVEAVARHLAACGMSPSQVVLEHNAGKTCATLVCGSGPGGSPCAASPFHGTFVRITVVARMNGFVPKLFGCLGVDFSTSLLRQSTTFPYHATKETH